MKTNNAKSKTQNKREKLLKEEKAILKQLEMLYTKSEIDYKPETVRKENSFESINRREQGRKSLYRVEGWQWIKLLAWRHHEGIEDPIIDQISKEDDDNIPEPQKLKNQWEATPFRLLPNVSSFKVNLGGYNAYLASFNMWVRAKLGDTILSKEDMIKLSEEGKKRLKRDIKRGRDLKNPTKYEVKTNDTENSRLNSYLRHQYYLLALYREKGQSEKYFKRAEMLMKYSQAFQMASLNKWNPTWYKNMSLSEVRRIVLATRSIAIDCKNKMVLKNLWIQSPYPKWRMLSIPPKSWRLYMRMWSDILSFWLEPLFDKKSYHGFLYNRGTKTWWEEVIQNQLHKENILEFDLKSFFHQVDLMHVKEALMNLGRTGEGVANHLLNILNCERRGAEAPTAELKQLATGNNTWSKTSRGLPMGIGISPLLGILVFKMAWEKLNLPDRYQIVSYADDASIFFNGKMSGIKEELENSWVLRKYGIILEESKTKWVKREGKAMEDYQALGLRYIWESKELKGWTRSGTKATIKDNHGEALNLTDLFKRNKEVFGTIMAKLYTGEKWMNIKQDFNKKAEAGSLIDCLRGKDKGLDCFNMSSWANEKLALMMKGNLWTNLTAARKMILQRNKGDLNLKKINKILNSVGSWNLATYYGVDKLFSESAFKGEYKGVQSRKGWEDYGSTVGWNQYRKLPDLMNPKTIVILGEDELGERNKPEDIRKALIAGCKFRELEVCPKEAFKACKCKQG